MSEPVRFWSLKHGQRFDDGIGMWSFVKRGWCTATYYDTKLTVFMLPWLMVIPLESEADHE